MAAHILVVDDDRPTREALAQQLSDAGYRVTTAEDALAAGHDVIAEVPDLIVMDFKMPYMNGDDFVAAMRADATLPDVPVVFITSPENSAQLAGKTFGFPLLRKPINGEALIAAVRSQLKR